MSNIPNIRIIPITNIHEPPVVLRVVNRRTLEYEEMLDSIKEHGLFNSLCVRLAPHRGPEQYEVVDGLYRFNCCRDACIPEVPATVHEVSDRLLLSLQIQANAIRPETTRMEYARQISKIMETDSLLTLPDVAAIVHKSPNWVNRMLGLLKLNPALQRQVDRGEITVSNAYWLSQMHKSYRADYVQDAENMVSDKFRLMAQSRIKAFREAINMGSVEAFYAKQYTPYPHLRNLRDIEAERLSLKASTSVMPRAKCQTPLDGWRMALAWVVHMDEESLAILHETAEARKKVMAFRNTKRRKAILEVRKQQNPTKNDNLGE